MINGYKDRINQRNGAGQNRYRINRNLRRNGRVPLNHGRHVMQFDEARIQVEKFETQNKEEHFDNFGEFKYLVSTCYAGR